MSKIIAFAGTSSRRSINKQLVSYAAGLIKGPEVEVLDLNDFELPLYSIDREKEDGIPQNAREFFGKIAGADGLILSLAEHNGTYTAVFKNLFDWLSRINKNLWSNKPMLLMATSTGARGGQSVLNAATARFKFHAGNIQTTFSLPEFIKNFSKGAINDEILNNELMAAVVQLENAIKKN